MDSLSEAEREQIERAALADPELLENIEALEDELILDYLQGRLGSQDRSRFEAAYRQETRWRRVERMRALVDAVASDVPRETEAARPPVLDSDPRHGWQAFFDRFRLAFAAAAMAAIGGVVVWLSQHGQDESRNRSETGTKIVASLRLDPAARTRGSGMDILPLPGPEGWVRFAMRIAEDPGGAVEVGLGRVESRPEEQWKGEARREGQDRLVTVEVPARFLVRGDYVLRLSAGGQPAGSYQFRVD